jgi:hypothetical protein
MKNSKKIVLLFLSILCTFEIGTAQDRNSLWLQGVGKAQTDIRGYADKFQAERKMTSYRQAYTSQNQAGIAATSTTVANAAQTQFSATPSNLSPIVVGHDMGGLMARKMEGNFGGLILKGTPNKGMPLVEAYAGGQLNNFAKLGNEKLAGKIMVDFCVPGVSSGTKISPADIPLEWSKVTFGNLPLSESVADMTPTSSFYQSMTEPTKPVAVIWGNENEPSMWRMFSSGSCKTIGALSIGGSGSVGSDVGLATDISMQRDTLKSKKNRAIGFGILKEIGGVASFALGIVTVVEAPTISAGFLEISKTLIKGGIKDFKTASALKPVIDWIDDSPTMWNSLIGAVATNTITTTSMQLSPSCQALVDGPMGWGAYYSLTSAQQEACYVPVTTVVEQFINGPSDGLLSKYTQTNVASVKDYEGVGANHEEELNHGSITDAYEKIWDGDAGDKFQTDRR